MREALKSSASVRAARATLESARVIADRGRPVARPTVTAIAAGTAQGPRVAFPRAGGGSSAVLPEGVAHVDLVAEQAVYQAGARAARDRYTAQLLVADLDFRTAVSAVALAVRRAYIDLLRAVEGVRAAKDGVDEALRYQRLVERQISSGVSKPIDAQTVEAQVAEAQVGLESTEGQLSLAKFNFNRLLGRPMRAAVSASEMAAVPETAATPDEAIARALHKRPELLILEQNLAAAWAGVSLAKAQAMPTVTARGQATEQTPNVFQHEHYYAATLEIRLPLLDGGKSRQDVREAKAQADRIVALRDDARQGIELETLQAWEKVRAARANIVRSATQRRGLEATSNVAVKAYEVGRGTVIEVQAAQREVRRARGLELSAIYDLQTAYSDLLYSQGDILTGVDGATLLEIRR